MVTLILSPDPPPQRASPPPDLQAPPLAGHDAAARQKLLQLRAMHRELRLLRLEAAEQEASA